MSREETCLTFQLIDCDLSLTHFLSHFSAMRHCPQFSLAPHILDGFLKQPGQLPIFPLDLLHIFEAVSHWALLGWDVPDAHNYFYFISNCDPSFATVASSSTWPSIPCLSYAGLLLATWLTLPSNDLLILCQELVLVVTTHTQKQGWRSTTLMM